jgi:hypothetical protein
MEAGGGMVEVVIITAVVAVLPGYVLGFALCRAAARRDGCSERVVIDSLPYDRGATLAQPHRMTSGRQRTAGR